MINKLCILSALLILSFSSTFGSDPKFTFTLPNQTITEDFNTYRGTEATLPADIFVEWDTSRISNPFTGVGELNDPESDYGGLTAFTADNENFSFGIRERAPIDLRDARVFLPIKNETGTPIRFFLISYDVETWFNGQRDNRIRLKYDDIIASGRFEEDLASTINPLGGGEEPPGLRTDGSDPDNRLRVEVLVDLEEYAHPDTGIFGALPDGETAWFRWQVSNADIGSGSLRSGLAINNLEIQALSAQALEWRPGVGGSGVWNPTGGNDWNGGEWQQEALAIFGDAPGTVTLNGTLEALLVEIRSNYTFEGGPSDRLIAPGGLLIGDGATATFNALLEDDQDFVKAGLGALVLSQSQDYTGATRIRGGDLIMDDENLLPDSAEMVISPGARFILNGFNQRVNGLRGERGGTVDLGLNSNLTLSNTGYREFRADIIGNGSLILDGPGTQRFRSEDKEYTGETIINQGVIEVTENGQMTMTSGIFITEGGELSLVREEGFYLFGGDIFLEGGDLSATPDGDGFSTIILQNDIEIGPDGGSIYARGADTEFELDGEMRGIGTFRKQGQGLLRILGESSRAGGIDVRNGTVEVNPFFSPNASFGTGPLLFGSGDNHRRLELLTASQTVSLLSGDVDLDEQNEPIGSAVLYLGPGHTLTIDQSEEDAPTEDDGSRFQGSIEGPGNLVKTGTGYLRLTRTPNPFTGTLTIEQGVLGVSDGSAPSGILALTVEPGGQLRLTSGSNEENPIRTYTFGNPGSIPLSLSGTGRSGVDEGSGMGLLGALRYEPGGSENEAVLINPVVLEPQPDWAAVGLHVSGSGNSLRLEGEISGPGSLEIEKSGGGDLVIGHPNPDLSSSWLINNGGVILEPSGNSGPGAIEVTSNGILGGGGTVGGPADVHGRLVISTEPLWGLAFEDDLTLRVDSEINVGPESLRLADEPGVVSPFVVHGELVIESPSRVSVSGTPLAGNYIILEYSGFDAEAPPGIPDVVFPDANGSIEGETYWEDNKLFLQILGVALLPFEEYLVNLGLPTDTDPTDFAPGQSIPLIQSYAHGVAPDARGRPSEIFTIGPQDVLVDQELINVFAAEFILRNDPALSVILEYSFDLQDWETATLHESTPLDNPDFSSIVWIIEEESNGVVFGRLRYSLSN